MFTAVTTTAEIIESRTVVPASKDAFRSPLLAEALAMWMGLGGNGMIPRWQGFLPEEHPGLWGNLAVLDVMDDGRDYRIRYYGNKLVRTYGEQTGRRISQMENSAGVRLRGKVFFDTCVARAAPVYLYLPVTESNRREGVDVEVLGLPFTRGGHSIDTVMACVINAFVLDRDIVGPL